MKIPFLEKSPSMSWYQDMAYGLGVSLAVLRIIFVLIMAKAFFAPTKGDEWSPVIFMLDFPVGLIGFYGVCYSGFSGIASIVWLWVSFTVGSLLGVYWHFVWPQLIALIIRNTVQWFKGSAR